MTSKRAYNSTDPHADYADQQGAPVEAFIGAGWKPNPRRWCSKLNMHRPAWEYHTPTGWRVRYLDGLEPHHDSPSGYKASWYRLSEAIAIAKATGQPLILVNGAAGTIAAQWHGLAAFAVSDGEQRDITPMLNDLKAVWQGEIWIAQDCDPAGQASATKRARAGLNAGFIVTAKDLQLGKNGDIADFCKLHGDAALERLADLPELTPDAPLEPRTVTYTTSGQGHYSEWIREIPRADIEKLPTRHEGHIDRFQCIDPAHLDEHWSARISFDKSPDGIYICSCGKKLNWNDIAALRGLQSYKEWVKERYPRQKLHRRKNSPQRESRRDHQPPAISSVGQPESDVITAQWVGDVLTPAEIVKHKTLLIDAPTGMGKTTALKLFALWLTANRPDTILTGYAQYRLLTAVLAKALDASHYEDADAGYVGGLQYENRLVTSVSSAPKFPRSAGGVVIPDETEGDLQFILSSTTFRNSGAIRSWRAIKTAWSEAGLFIGMDAGLSDITIDLIRKWRGEVTVKRFRKPESRGEAIMLNSPIAAIYQVGKMLQRNRGLVTVGTSSEAKATDIADFFSAWGYRVKKVTSDTSLTDATRRFVTDPAARTGYDLLVYDSAMGAGAAQGGKAFGYRLFVEIAGVFPF